MKQKHDINVVKFEAAETLESTCGDQVVSPLYAASGSDPKQVAHLTTPESNFTTRGGHIVRVIRAPCVLISTISGAFSDARKIAFYQVHPQLKHAWNG